ncbi:MAG: glycosyltransferase family 4 protein [Candidatus Latescibacteria bacterium]|nr:glycosyltransferase family 4 protein [Candidatus Latescibacterota bacterium]
MPTEGRRVKVVHLITRLDRGGSAEVVLQLAARLDRDRYDVEVVSGRTIDPVCDLAHYTRTTGVPITMLPRLRREVAPADDPIACVQVYRYLRRSRPDLVHTHSSKAGIVGRLAARAAGTPVIVHAPHGHVFYGYFGRLATHAFILAERLTARWTDRIITLTELEKQDHLRVRIGRPEQFVPIPCGIDLSRFSAAEQEGRTLREGLQLRPGELLVLWAGRLVPIKGCDAFLRACTIVVRQHDTARFVIVGDGPLAESLRKMASRLGLDDRVRFVGYRSDIPAWMWAADVFVLSSLNEGLGRVLLEAMACQTPIVATDVGGVSEIVQTGETGLLVPPADPERLAEGILTLLRETERARAMGERGYQRALGFDLRVMVDRTAAVYESLLTAKGVRHAA